MPHIAPLQPNDAIPEVRDIYENFRRRMQFPAAPNFILTQGHSLAAVRGSWDLVRNLLVLGQLPRWTKEMVFVAISQDRDCQYCLAAHLACCRMLGVDPKMLAALVRDVNSISDLKLRNMILFAVRCSRDPRGLTRADFDKLKEQGLDQAEIMELVAMSALAVYANIIADATAMEADAIFDEIQPAMSGAGKTAAQSSVA
jgi:uncharacterized peroxidase-related enzyme